MDLHALPRRDLQALAKRNGVRANMSNAAMADALAALPAVDGIEEYLQQPVAEPTPAAEPEVRSEEEEEKEAPAEEEEPEKQEVIVLDDSEEEEKDLTADQDEEKAPTPGVGRRRATRCTRAEPVAAPATRRRSAASKADEADTAVEAVPARATRGRSQRTVAEDEAPKARRTSRRAVAKKAGTEQEDEEKGTQGDVSSDEGGDGAAQSEEQNAPVEEQSQEDESETVKEDSAAEAVPARTTRGRSRRTAAAEEAPKARRTSRRAGARKTGTEQEEEEKGTQGDVSDMEATTAAPVSSDDRGHGAAQNEQQSAPLEEQSQEDAAVQAVPARATRARRQRTVESAAEEEAPKARRTSRRAVARKTAAGQEEQDEPVEEQSQEGEGETEKVDTAAAAVPARATRARSQKKVVWADQLPKTRRTSTRDATSKTSTEQEEAHGDVSDVEAAVPAPVSSDEVGHAVEEMEAAMDAQNEEQFAAAEAVPARTTRARRQRTVVSAAEEVAPKARRTSRRAAARKTSTEQEEEQKATQGDVADGEATVPASDEEADGSEEMEMAIGAQNQEQNELIEEQSQGEEGETGVVDITAPVEEEPPVAEDCVVDSSVEEQQCEDSPVVLAVAEQEASHAFQNDAVSSEGIHHASEDEEMVPVDEVLQTPLNVSHATKENEVPTAEEVVQSADKAIDEQEDMAAGVVTNNTDVSVEDMASDASEEDEDCTAEDVDSSVQEPLVHVQQCEEIHLAGEDAEMVPVNELQQAMLESGEATEEVDSASDVGEENEDWTAEEEPPLADDVDSSVQEPLIDVQECEATKEIQFASEDAEMMPINEVQQAVLESSEAIEDVASDFGEENEDCTVEEEPPVADADDVSVQEPLVDVQQCEATEEIHLATEDTEMVPVLESGEVTEEADFNSYACEQTEAPTSAEMLQNAAKVVEENEVPTSCEVLQSSAKAVEENEDMDADEVPHNTGDYVDTDEYVEEEAVVATEEMPQISEAMDQGVVEVVTVENLSQGTITDDEGAVKESGFSCDLADVSVEEKEVVAAEGMPQTSATIEENVEEVFTVDNLSQATVTDDEGAVKESGFTGELMDVPVEEEGVVAAAEIPHSSAKMDEDVQEEVVTVDNLSQDTETDEEGAVKESVFSCGLSVLSVDEEGVMPADQMQLSSATMNMSVEEVVTVDNLSQATVTDDEWAVKESAFTGECTPLVDAARDFSDHIASPFSANVFEYATKSLSMDSITVETTASEPADVPLCMYSSSGGKKDASELGAVQRENEVKEGNKPEAAFGRIIHSPLTIRKLRMAVAQENEVDDVPPLTIRKVRMPVAQENEADDAPLCIFDSSSCKKNASEVVAVQLENEVKEGSEPEAAFGRIIHSPLTIRKLRMAVAQEIEADDVPPLTIRKLKTEVARENEADGVPLCIFSSNGGEENASEHVAVQRENEVKEEKEPEAAFGRIIHSPLTIRKLRIAVAQEIEADDVPPLTVRKLRTEVARENAADEVPLCIFSSSGGDENSAEPLLVGSLSRRKLRANLNEKVAVAQEYKVKEGEKSSAPLDKLSLRKLRLKLKETLTAQKNMEPKRVALGRLDENAC